MIKKVRFSYLLQLNVHFMRFCYSKAPRTFLLMHRWPWSVLSCFWACLANLHRGSLQISCLWKWQTGDFKPHSGHVSIDGIMKAVCNQSTMQKMFKQLLRADDVLQILFYVKPWNVEQSIFWFTSCSEQLWCIVGAASVVDRTLDFAIKRSWFSFCPYHFM